MRRLGVVRLGTAALVAGVALTGCSEPTPAGDGLPWPRAEQPLDAQGLTWGRDHTIHLPDGSTIDTKHPFHEYAVAGDSIWFTRTDPGDPQRAADRGRLWRATKDSVEPTEAYAKEFRATTDGRYLVYLDDVTGPKPDDGTTIHVLVVVDTATGEETVRTTEGMDGGGPVGLAEQYEEGEPWFAALTDETAYVDSLGSWRAYDLDTGDVDRVDDEEVPGVGDGSSEPVWNDARTWAIEGPVPFQDTFLSVDGQRVAPRSGTPRRSLIRWLDGDTAVGYAVAGEVAASIYRPGDVATLITCDVPSGACVRIPGTEHVPVDTPSLLPGRAIATPRSAS